MTLVGSPDRFALGFALLPFPDPGGRPELRASWGALTLWVGGRNLTAARLLSGASVDCAQVPLLPVAQWFLRNWDYLFHEERLPRPTTVGSAAAWRLASLRRLPEGEADLDDLLEARERWWSRHGLGSSLPDFRIPDLHLRRMADQIEVSWDDAEWRQLPRGVQLIEHPGSVLLPVADVSQTVRSWCVELANAFREIPALKSAADALLDDLAGLDAPSRSLLRAEIAVGNAIRRLAVSLRAMAGVVGGTVDETVQSILSLGETPRADGVILSLPVPALLFRSASPTLTEDDLNTILSITRDREPASEKLEPFLSPSPPSGSPDAMTQEGYDLATDFRNLAGLGAFPLRGELDLERLLRDRFGVVIKDIHLDDIQVDGIAMVTPRYAPVIAVNRSGRFARTAWGRRMTLAHELCHILHDMTDRGSVGVVSSPWASYPLERRANAFAAMLLAPEAALRKLLSRDSEGWTSADLREVMKTLGVGISTLTWHLYNLHWISESERQAWVDELYSA